MFRMSEEEYELWCKQHGVPNRLRKQQGTNPQPQHAKNTQNTQSSAQNSAVGQDISETAPKKNKYGNHPVYVYKNGAIRYKKDKSLGDILEYYASQSEFKRHHELLLLQRAGKIRDVKRQVPILIQEAFLYHGVREKPIYYVADFMYINSAGKTVVEDVKGYDTAKEKFMTTSEFRLKWKLLKHRYPDYVFQLHE